MTTNISATRTFAIDLAERAANAAWQGAAGAAAPVLIAANATSIAHASWWEQVAAIAVAGAVSAVGSLAKGVTAGLKTGTASLSQTVAETAVTPGAHAADYTPDPALPTTGAGLTTAYLAAVEPTPLNGLPPVAPLNPDDPDPYMGGAGATATTIPTTAGAAV